VRALHVSGGIAVIAFLAWRSFTTREPRGVTDPVQAAGLCGYFVNIVWLILLPLLDLNS
jgi:heme/copper-type cytochrome/quinol oxidase subunit 3